MAFVAREKGKILRINTDYDLSSATAFTLTVVAPDGTVSNINAVFTVGSVDVTDPDTNDVLKAYHYVEYVTDGTEFAGDGDYQLKLSGDFGATKTLKSIDSVLYVHP